MNPNITTTRIERCLGHSVERKHVSFPKDIRWVRARDGYEGFTWKYWTAIPTSKYKEKEWHGWAIKYCAFDIIYISLDSVIANPALDCMQIDGPDLMREFELNGRTIASIYEGQDCYALGALCRIHYADSPTRVRVTRMDFSNCFATEELFNTSLQQLSLANMPVHGSRSEWFTLPKKKGDKVWEDFRGFMFSMYDGKPAKLLYNLTCDFGLEDENASMIDIVMAFQPKLQAFFDQFGIKR